MRSPTGDAGWPPFADRAHAGRVLAGQLADELTDLSIETTGHVLALPRGGVPVAAPVATALGCPLGVVVVRKLGVPGRPELAMGAVARIGSRVHLIRNTEVMAMARVSPEAFDRVRRSEEAVLERRAAQLGSLLADVTSATVVLVDDGLATGSTMLAAVGSVRAAGAHRVVVAVPVGSQPALRAMGEVADDVRCAYAPATFVAVGIHYRDFTQTSDAEVLALLGGTRGVAENHETPLP